MPTVKEVGRFTCKARVTLLVASTLAFAACDGGMVSDPPTSTVTVLEILGSTAALVLQGQTVQLTGRATYSDGVVEDITVPVQWTSANTNVAMVAGGVVTAVGTGSTEISMKYRGRTATRSVTIDLSNDPGWESLGGIDFGTIIDGGVYQLVVDPRDNNLLYAAGVYGFFVSRDGGTTWSELYASPFPGWPALLEQDPNDPDRVFYAMRYTLGVTDAGMTWSAINDFPSGIRSVGVSRFDDRTIYVGLQSPSNDGIYRSTDDGVTWESHSFGYPISGATEFIPWDIAEDAVDGTLYVATELHDHPQPYRAPAFRSVDRGLTWQDMTGSLPWHGSRILIHPVTREVLFLTEGAGLFSSTDRGTSWRQVGNAYFALTLLMDLNEPGRFFGGEVFFGGRLGGVLLSTDDKRTFFHYGLGGRTCGSLAITGDSSLLYAVCGGQIFVRRLP